MDAALAPSLRAALVAAGFTVDGVAEVLGPRAHDALLRNETAPGLARTRGGSPVEVLVRLFLLQTSVPLADAERALPGLVDRLAVAGLLDQSVGEVVARLDCRPYATEEEDLWVVSDLTPGLDGGPQRVGPDHVLGISPASTSLAQLTLREEVGSALDLGTGCGVQALHLARHAGRVVATDVNARALAVARFNAALNEVEVDVRDGSFFAPVRGERFDLVATNPPFVISPGRFGRDERLVYRDSGLPGDEVVEHVVRRAPDHLAPGGWCQVLANWVVERGRSWDDRLAGWLPAEHDALVVQREVLDPAAYVELWLKDAGRHGAPDYLERYDTWLSWFDDQGIEAVGFGWVNLHHTGEAAVRHDLLSWPYDVEQPIAEAVGQWGRAARVADGVGPGDHLVVRPDVVQETHGPVGVADPETIVLRQQRGFRRARTADTVEAALVGACDGDLPLGAILDAVAQLLDADPEQTRATYLPVARDLVAEGFLSPS
ncbi:N5-glutamine methyltransferase family protein [Nocardioides litoris]|uniref:N5-glutamine methyltransferase family protein n=1 Tax=Nocardioides litoris TaxID=1926648 RepID=UPI00111FEE2D|nr:class I SAM-dependent methyltransferase [Nocardioides litoris]